MTLKSTKEGRSGDPPYYDYVLTFTTRVSLKLLEFGM